MGSKFYEIPNIDKIAQNGMVIGHSSQGNGILETRDLTPKIMASISTLEVGKAVVPVADISPHTKIQN